MASKKIDYFLRCYLYLEHFVSKQNCMYSTAECWSFNKTHLRHRSVILVQEKTATLLESETCQTVLLWRAGAVVLQEELQSSSLPWPEGRRVSWHGHQLLHAAQLLCWEASSDFLLLAELQQPLRNGLWVWHMKESVRMLRGRRCILAFWNGRVSCIRGIPFTPSFVSCLSKNGSET